MARQALKNAPKGQTAEQLEKVVRETVALTTPTRKALVQEEISRRANAEEEKAEINETGKPLPNGRTRESIQQDATAAALGQHPYVHVPKGSTFKPNGVEGLNKTNVNGAGDLSGTYWHAKDIKSSEMRDAVQKGTQSDLIEQWKAKHPQELSNDDVEQVPGENVQNVQNVNSEGDRIKAGEALLQEHAPNLLQAFREDRASEEWSDKEYAQHLDETVKDKGLKAETEKPKEETKPEKTETPGKLIVHEPRTGKTTTIPEETKPKKPTVVGDKIPVTIEGIPTKEENEAEDRAVRERNDIKRIAAGLGPVPEPEPAAPPVEAKDGSVHSLVNAIYAKLEAGESLGNVTKLTELAEQHFGSSRVSGKWTPKDMFDAMEAAVNRYLIAHGARWMEMPGEEALAELRDLMGRLTTQGTRTEEQIAKQQFSTPPTESFVAARAAALTPNDVVLEPSAGNGGLAAWPKSIGAEVHVNEISDRRQDMLRAAGFDEPTAHNGEVIHALLDQSVKPTVILMNPPFSAGALGGRNRNVYGFNHVESALQRLEDGGRLVAILGGGQANEPNGGASLTNGASGTWFQKLAKMYNVRANIRVNGKEYAKYGTGFATRIIVIDKDGPTKDLAQVVQKNVDTLEEAYAALEPVTSSRPELARKPEAGNDQSLAGSQPAGGLDATAGSNGRGGRGSLSGGRGGKVAGRPRDDTQQASGASGTGDTGGRIEPVAGSQAAHQPESDTADEPADGLAGTGGDLHPVGRTGEAGRGLVPDADIERVARSKAGEEEDSSNFVKYQPSIKGAEHPGAIVESKTMATVPLPPFTYKPSLMPRH